jgi:hypothetical protein
MVGRKGNIFAIKFRALKQYILDDPEIFNIIIQYPVALCRYDFTFHVLLSMCNVH